VSREIEGKVKPLESIEEQDLQELSVLLSKLKRLVTKSSTDFIFLIDGYDRLPEPEKLRLLLESDLALLRNAGIGVILAAPLIVAYLDDPAIQAYFDSFTQIWPIAIDERGIDILVEVLDHRNAFSLLDKELGPKLAKYSGGILRDLVALAKDSAQNAYMEAADHISEGHLDDAIQQLGTRYAKAANGSSNLHMLRRLDSGDTDYSFDRKSSNHRSLLIHRCIIERENGFFVHPALALRFGDTTKFRFRKV
jgi:hypothetical protein